MTNPVVSMLLLKGTAIFSMRRAWLQDRPNELGVSAELMTTLAGAVARAIRVP
ncbi:hypothetical protein FHX14_005484 [Rhizobium sp. BK619]|nr:hypothetical protein [Rhizobium sp. BK619]